MVDAQYADYVVAITDTLVPFPNIPASISMTDVDAVVVVDAIGDPVKIATGPAKPTTDMRKLLMARYTTEFLIHTPYYKEASHTKQVRAALPLPRRVFLPNI